MYPQIVRSVSAQLEGGVSPDHNASTEIVRTLTAQSVDKIVNTLTFSHLELLINIEDSLKRAFYEIECIKGNWSVRQLKRQIGSLLFERTGLSRKPEVLTEMAHLDSDAYHPELIIRDPYIFEFLKLKSSEVMYESDLEQMLLDKLQSFMLELGRGFCLEARQKRISIGNEDFFIDLVFYHRTLKCHVLVELKVDHFKHESLGQLNTYLNWYRSNMMESGDNPPVGLLLCTEKNHALVEYALAGMDNWLFVSKYQLELPDPEQIKKYIEEQRRQIEG